MRKHNAIRLIVALLAILLVIPCIAPAVSANTSGACGENLQWEFSGGTLTITGSGAMADYSEADPAPWSSLRSKIVNLSLPEGLTRVGSYAFAQCDQLVAVALPETVTEIGENGFFACERLRFVSLSANLKKIEDSGFERCLQLQTVTLPYGLEHIGYQAFWRCESLISVTIPATVTHLDMAVFAYCYSLIRAQIDAPIPEVPQWLFYNCHNLSAVTLPAAVKGADEYAFYGCETLDTVYYPGDRQDAQDLIEDIDDYLDGFSEININSGSSNSASNVVEKPEGDTNQQVSSNFTKTEEAEVVTQITQQFPKDDPESDPAAPQTPVPGSTQIQINATVNGDSGWEDVVEETEETLKGFGNQLQDDQKVSVNVQVSQGVEVDTEVLAPLAGKPVELTIQTAGGHVWTVDCSKVTKETLKENLVLSYTLTPAEEKWSKKLGGAETYLLKFHNDMEINARVQVRIPTVPARATAFLYQRTGSSLRQLQAVMVDDDGYAHFYLGAVDTKTDYFIGINVANGDTENVLIPQPLQQDQLIPPMQNMDYVITGRKSSWGMNIWQVTGILVAVIVVSVAVVGGVLFMMNKRKLQQEKTPGATHRRKK